MNKRFKELARRAGFVLFSKEEDPKEPIDWASNYDRELEHFGSIIVAICADIARNKSEPHQDIDEDILEYFGLNS